MKVLKGTPGLPPGTCYLCLTARSGTYVDTERYSPDGFDRVYLCETCASEVARAAGFVPASELAEANERLAAYEKRARTIATAYRSVARLRSTLASIFSGEELDSVPALEEVVEAARALSKRRKEGEPGD